MAKKKNIKRKNNKKKSKAKAKTKKHQKRSLIKALFKWCFILGLWGGIFLSILLAYYASDLPDITKNPQFEHRTSITIKASDGSLITRRGDIRGDIIATQDIPSHLIYAVIATEDRRFFQHLGIDPFGIARAFATNLKKGRVAQGGSTITQQLAKNLFLSRERTLKRKSQEAMLAIWLERELTKDEILSAYLNRVYLGSGTYGVEAAAKLYFNRAAKDLNLQQSATIAGLLKAPSRYSPLNNPELSKQRTKIVLKNMANAGYITQGQARNFSQVFPKALKKTTGAKSARYYTDWVIDQLHQLIGAPNEDLIITTTLVPAIQTRAQKSLQSTIAANSAQRKVHQGAVVSLAHDGAVLAMVGGVDYGTSQFNRAVQARRPPGSAFKPIVYLTALQKGYSPDDPILDAPITSGDYHPKNFNDKYRGETTLEDALTYSLNTPSVRLMQKITPRAVINTAKQLGISSRLDPNLSLALGSSGISLLEMTNAYTVIANGGYKATPYAITKIQSAKDDYIYYERRKNKSSKRIIERRDARNITTMLRNAIENGTGRRAKLPYPASGKTGTSQNSRDAWFIGYTGDIATGVWLGNDDNSPMENVTGGGFPAQIWKDIMSHSKEDYKDNKSRHRSSGFGFRSLMDRLTGASNP